MPQIACPKCHGKLQVPTGLRGQVRCPHCAVAFSAVVGAVNPPPLPLRPKATVHFKCPLCGALYDRPEKFAGEILSCPSCHERIEVPRAAPKGAVIGEVVDAPLQSPSAAPPSLYRWDVWPSYSAEGFKRRFLAVLVICALLLVVLVVSIGLLLVVFLVTTRGK